MARRPNPLSSDQGTCKYIHLLDATLVISAETLSGYIAALLDGVVFRQRASSLDRDALRAAQSNFIARQKRPLPMRLFICIY